MGRMSNLLAASLNPKIQDKMEIQLNLYGRRI